MHIFNTDRMDFGVQKIFKKVLWKICLYKILNEKM